MAKTRLLNYSDRNFRSAQRLNSRTGSEVAGFDEVISYGPKDIDPAFRKANKNILDQKRGGGYWLWKPYFIHRTLQEMAEGDWLFYCDSGSYFIAPIETLIRELAPYRQDIFPFLVHNHLEKHWTKPDVLSYLASDRQDILESEQRMGTCHLWRRSSYSVAFAEQWLQEASKPHLIMDFPAAEGTEGLNGFEEHRHDQSIFSVLTKLHGLRAFRDPSQYGNRQIGDTSDSPYPQILQLTRKRDVPLMTRVLRELKHLLR